MTPTTNRKQYVLGVEALSVFAVRCRHCGGLTVLGGWHQLTRVPDPRRGGVRAWFGCGACGRGRWKFYRATAGRVTRRRLVPWEKILMWFFWRGYVHRLPERWRWRLLRWVGFLERRVPL